MKHLDLLLPFALAPAEHARDLLRALDAPALANLLGRADAAGTESADDYARALPHERWLCRAAGLAAPESASPPLAAPLLQSANLNAKEGHWFVLQPVHVHIARDHLVLTDPRRLALPDTESRALFALARPLFEAAGFALEWGSAAHWFVRADAWSGLVTATPDAACGRNIDIWLPQGDAARAWRKLQNEVQMEWHASQVAEAREARGANAVNSLWLWGGASLPLAAQTAWAAHLDAPDWAAALGGSQAADMKALLAQDTGRGLAVAHTLAEAALGSDWGEWLLRLTQLERDWFAPLFEALRAGRLDSVSVVLSDHIRLRELKLTRGSLRKFWRRPSLARLAP